jgi:aryl-alcohol dehydrogenase-like predicted oxidoreductase
VKRLGYGAMQLAGPGVFGPPKDRDGAIRVLREAVASGVNHIDTSDYYGPHVTNLLIREALHPYPDDLVIVAKIGARRGTDGSWLPAISPAELTSAIHDNLRNLGLDALDVVNMRSMFGQNLDNLLADRRDDALIDELARAGISYAVPDFPLGGSVRFIICSVRRCSAVWRHAYAGRSRLVASRSGTSADPAHVVCAHLQ